ncbi:hypothetical protein GZH53_06730 [Flavihumibacter sp. R14]|nr:hypothetical protein [Flavihumibacter soli]
MKKLLLTVGTIVGLIVVVKALAREGSHRVGNEMFGGRVGNGFTGTKDPYKTSGSAGEKGNGYREEKSGTRIENELIEGGGPGNGIAENERTGGRTS